VEKIQIRKEKLEHKHEVRKSNKIQGFNDKKKGGQPTPPT
jgi:hypothetical protein